MTSSRDQELYRKILLGFHNPDLFPSYNLGDYALVLAEIDASGKLLREQCVPYAQAFAQSSNSAKIRNLSQSLGKMAKALAQTSQSSEWYNEIWKDLYEKVCLYDDQEKAAAVSSWGDLAEALVLSDPSGRWFESVWLPFYEKALQDEIWFIRKYAAGTVNQLFQALARIDFDKGFIAEKGKTRECLIACNRIIANEYEVEGDFKSAMNSMGKLIEALSVSDEADVWRKSVQQAVLEHVQNNKSLGQLAQDFVEADSTGARIREEWMPLYNQKKSAGSLGGLAKAIAKLDMDTQVLAPEAHSKADVMRRVWLPLYQDIFPVHRGHKEGFVWKIFNSHGLYDMAEAFVEVDPTGSLLEEVWVPFFEFVMRDEIFSYDETLRSKIKGRLKELAFVLARTDASLLEKIWKPLYDRYGYGLSEIPLALLFSSDVFEGYTALNNRYEALQEKGIIPTVSLLDPDLSMNTIMKEWSLVQDSYKGGYLFKGDFDSLFGNDVRRDLTYTLYQKQISKVLFITSDGPYTYEKYRAYILKDPRRNKDTELSVTARVFLRSISDEQDEHVLKRVKRQIADLEAAGEELSYGANLETFVKSELFTQEEILREDFLDGLIELGVFSAFYGLLFPAIISLKKTYGDQFWDYWPVFVETGAQAGSFSYEFFSDCLVPLKPYVYSRENLSSIGNAFARRYNTVFHVRYGNELVLEFLQKYLPQKYIHSHLNEFICSDDREENDILFEKLKTYYSLFSESFLSGNESDENDIKEWCAAFLGANGALDEVKFYLWHLLRYAYTEQSPADIVVRYNELSENHIMPLPQMMISPLSVQDILKQIELVREGGMEKDNPLHVDINYFLLMSDYGFRPLYWENISYQQFLHMSEEAQKGLWEKESRIVSDKDELQIKGVVYEAYLLHSKILEIQKRAKELNRELVVVENLSLGVVCTAPITHELKGKKHIKGLDGLSIPVWSTKIGSNESHHNGTVMNPDLFTKEQMQYLIEKQPIVIVVDASDSVADQRRTSAHIPDGFKGFRNHFIAINSLMELSFLPEDFYVDNEFIQELKAASVFQKILKRYNDMGNSEADPYKFYFYYPGAKNLYLRIGKSKDQTAPKLTDPFALSGPSVVFIQTAVEPEAVPQKIKDEFIGGSHKPGFFDDKDEFKKFFVDYVEGRGFVNIKSYIDKSRILYRDFLRYVGKEDSELFSPGASALWARTDQSFFKIGLWENIGIGAFAYAAWLVLAASGVWPQAPTLFMENPTLLSIHLSFPLVFSSFLFILLYHLVFGVMLPDKRTITLWEHGFIHTLTAAFKAARTASSSLLAVPLVVYGIAFGWSAPLALATLIVFALHPLLNSQFDLAETRKFLFASRFSKNLFNSIIRADNKTNKMPSNWTEVYDLYLSEQPLSGVLSRQIFDSAKWVDQLPIKAGDRVLIVGNGSDLALCASFAFNGAFVDIVQPESFVGVEQTSLLTGKLERFDRFLKRFYGDDCSVVDRINTSRYRCRLEKADIESNTYHYIVIPSVLSLFSGIRLAGHVREDRRLGVFLDKVFDVLKNKGAVFISDYVSDARDSIVIERGEKQGLSLKKTRVLNVQSPQERFHFTEIIVDKNHRGLDRFLQPWVKKLYPEKTQQEVLDKTIIFYAPFIESLVFGLVWWLGEGILEVGWVWDGVIWLGLNVVFGWVLHQQVFRFINGKWQLDKNPGPKTRIGIVARAFVFHLPYLFGFGFLSVFGSVCLHIILNKLAKRFEWAAAALGNISLSFSIARKKIFLVSGIQGFFEKFFSDSFESYQEFLEAVDRLDEKEWSALLFIDEYLRVVLNGELLLDALRPYFETRFRGGTREEAIESYETHYKKLPGMPKELAEIKKYLNETRTSLRRVPDMAGKVHAIGAGGVSKTDDAQSVVIGMANGPIEELHLGWPSLGSSCLDLLIGGSKFYSAGYLLCPRAFVIYIWDAKDRSIPLGRVSCLLDPVNESVFLVSYIITSSPYNFDPIVGDYLKALAEDWHVSVVAPDQLGYIKPSFEGFSDGERQLLFHPQLARFYSDLTNRLYIDEKFNQNIKGWVYTPGEEDVTPQPPSQNATDWLSWVVAPVAVILAVMDLGDYEILVYALAGVFGALLGFVLNDVLGHGLFEISILKKQSPQFDFDRKGVLGLRFFAKDSEGTEASGWSGLAGNLLGVVAFGVAALIQGQITPFLMAGIVGNLVFVVFSWTDWKDVSKKTSLQNIITARVFVIARFIGRIFGFKDEQFSKMPNSQKRERFASSKFGNDMKKIRVIEQLESVIEWMPQPFASLKLLSSLRPLFFFDTRSFIVPPESKQAAHVRKQAQIAEVKAAYKKIEKAIAKGKKERIKISVCDLLFDYTKGTFLMTFPMPDGGKMGNPKRGLGAAQDLSALDLWVGCTEQGEIYLDLEYENKRGKTGETRLTWEQDENGRITYLRVPERQQVEVVRVYQKIEELKKKKEKGEFEVSQCDELIALNYLQKNFPVPVSDGGKLNKQKAFSIGKKLRFLAGQEEVYYQLMIGVTAAGTIYLSLGFECQDGTPGTLRMNWNKELRDFIPEAALIPATLPKTSARQEQSVKKPLKKAPSKKQTTQKKQKRKKPKKKNPVQNKAGLPKTRKTKRKTPKSPEDMQKLVHAFKADLFWDRFQRGLPYAEDLVALAADQIKKEESYRFQAYTRAIEKCVEIFADDERKKLNVAVPATCAAAFLYAWEKAADVNEAARALKKKLVVTEIVLSENMIQTSLQLRNILDIRIPAEYSVQSSFSELPESFANTQQIFICDLLGLHLHQKKIEAFKQAYAATSVNGLFIFAERKGVFVPKELRKAGLGERIVVLPETGDKEDLVIIEKKGKTIYESMIGDIFYQEKPLNKKSEEASGKRFLAVLKEWQGILNLLPNEWRLGEKGVHPDSLKEYYGSRVLEEQEYQDLKVFHTKLVEGYNNWQSFLEQSPEMKQIFKNLKDTAKDILDEKRYVRDFNPVMTTGQNFNHNTIPPHWPQGVELPTREEVEEFERLFDLFVKDGDYLRDADGALRLEKLRVIYYAAPELVAARLAGFTEVDYHESWADKLSKAEPGLLTAVFNHAIAHYRNGKDKVFEIEYRGKTLRVSYSLSGIAGALFKMGSKSASRIIKGIDEENLGLLINGIYSHLLYKRVIDSSKGFVLTILEKVPQQRLRVVKNNLSGSCLRWMEKVLSPRFNDSSEQDMSSDETNEDSVDELHQFVFRFQHDLVWPYLNAMRNEIWKLPEEDRPLGLLDEIAGHLRFFPYDKVDKVKKMTPEYFGYVLKRWEKSFELMEQLKDSLKGDAINELAALSKEKLTEADAMFAEMWPDYDWRAQAKEYFGDSEEDVMPVAQGKEDSLAEVYKIVFDFQHNEFGKEMQLVMGAIGFIEIAYEADQYMDLKKMYKKVIECLKCSVKWSWHTKKEELYSPEFLGFVLKKWEKGLRLMDEMMVWLEEDQGEYSEKADLKNDLVLLQEEVRNKFIQVDELFREAMPDFDWRTQAEDEWESSQEKETVSAGSMSESAVRMRWNDEWPKPDEAQIAKVRKKMEGIENPQGYEWRIPFDNLMNFCFVFPDLVAKRLINFGGTYLDGHLDWVRGLSQYPDAFIAVLINHAMELYEKGFVDSPSGDVIRKAPLRFLGVFLYGLDREHKIVAALEPERLYAFIESLVSYVDRFNDEVFDNKVMDVWEGLEQENRELILPKLSINVAMRLKQGNLKKGRNIDWVEEPEPVVPGDGIGELKVFSQNPTDEELQKLPKGAVVFLPVLPPYEADLSHVNGLLCYVDQGMASHVFRLAGAYGIPFGLVRQDDERVSDLNGKRVALSVNEDIELREALPTEITGRSQGPVQVQPHEVYRDQGICYLPVNDERLSDVKFVGHKAANVYQLAQEFESVDVENVEVEFVPGNALTFEMFLDLLTAEEKESIVQGDESIKMPEALENLLVQDEEFTQMLLHGVFVRSSTNAEDFKGVGAGVYGTEPNVKGSLYDWWRAVRRVLVSCFSEKALMNRRVHGMNEDNFAPAVWSCASQGFDYGVVIHVQDDHVMIDAVQGLAAPLVNGEEKGARIVLERDTGDVIKTTSFKQSKKVVLNAVFGGLLREDAEESDAFLNDWKENQEKKNVVEALRQLSVQASRILKSNQDIECGLKKTKQGWKIVVVQSREAVRMGRVKARTSASDHAYSILGFLMPGVLAGLLNLCGMNVDATSVFLFSGIAVVLATVADELGHAVEIHKKGGIPRLKFLWPGQGGPWDLGGLFMTDLLGEHHAAGKSGMIGRAIMGVLWLVAMLPLGYLFMGEWEILGFAAGIVAMCLAVSQTDVQDYWREKQVKKAEDFMRILEAYEISIKKADKRRSINRAITGENIDSIDEAGLIVNRLLNDTEIDLGLKEFGSLQDVQNGLMGCLAERVKNKDFMKALNRLLRAKGINISEAGITKYLTGLTGAHIYFIGPEDIKKPNAQEKLKRLAQILKTHYAPENYLIYTVGASQQDILRQAGFNMSRVQPIAAHNNTVNLASLEKHPIANAGSLTFYTGSLRLNADNVTAPAIKQAMDHVQKILTLLSETNWTPVWFNQIHHITRAILTAA